MAEERICPKCNTKMTKLVKAITGEYTGNWMCMNCKSEFIEK